MSKRETDGLSPGGYRRTALHWTWVAFVTTLTATALEVARTWTRTPTHSATFDDAPLRRTTKGTR